jgi:hypothetical protein
MRIPPKENPKVTTGPQATVTKAAAKPAPAPAATPIQGIAAQLAAIAANNPQA